MPPKKNDNGSEAPEGGKFQWEGANDIKLLLLTQGRYVKPDEYDHLCIAFPGTTYHSIRNRISNLRVRQRDLYQSLGWQLPEGGAGHSTKKARASTAAATGTAKGRKRAAESDGVSSAGAETAVKKPRARKSKKEVKEEIVTEEEAVDGVVEGVEEKGVKVEMEDDEV